MSRSVARGNKVIWQGGYGQEVGHISERGVMAYPTHVHFRESWLQLPAVKAALDTFTSSVAAAEMLAAMKANRNFSWLASNSGTIAFATGGGITLTTDTSDTDYSLVQPQLSTTQTAFSVAQFLSQNSPWFSTWIKTGASIAKTRYAIGFKLTNTDVPATDNDQCYVRYTDSLGTGDVSAANWQLVTSRSNVDVFFDTGIPVAASSIYRLEIVIDSAMVPHLFITAPQSVNGTTQYTRREIALDAASRAPLITAKAFIPYHIIAARGTTPGAKSLTLLPDFEVGHLAA